MTPDRTSMAPVAREWQPSELARHAEIGRFGHERDLPHAQTLQQAFAQDPVFDWIYGSLTADQQQAFWQLVLKGTRRGTEIHAAQQSHAVAIWIPPVAPDPDPDPAPQPPQPDPAPKSDEQDPQTPTVRDQLAAVLGDRSDEIFTVFGAMHEARPEEPHWYLQALGTRPEHQGKGWGARVLRPMLDRCDRLGLLAYLESTNPQNHAFYHRLGFVDAGEVVAGGAPPLKRMKRTPRS